MFSGTNFIFDKVPSETYNLYLVDFGENSKEDMFGVTYEIEEEKIKRNPVPYFYGIEQTPTLQFKMTVASEKELDRYDRHAISKWLFKKDYKYLQIDQEDIGNVYYRCIFLNPQKIQFGNCAYALQFDVKCDAPWAWSEEHVYEYTLSSSTTNIEFRNLSNYNDYLYPEIEFTLSITDTNFSITNSSDNSRIFEFTELNPSEIIYVNNQRKQVVSSEDTNRLCNFVDKKWFRLVPGTNQLIVSGKGSLEIRLRYPILI